MLHLIIGKYRTPNHSTKKEDKDDHEIKQQILDDITKKVYVREVGKNPDLDIDRDGMIVLVGRHGKFKGRRYKSKIHAINEGYFILKYNPNYSQTDNAIQLEFINPITERDELLLLITAYPNVYSLPNSQNVLKEFMDWYFNAIKDADKEMIVFFSVKGS